MATDLTDKYTWSNANLSCPGGWRLPARDELQCLCNSAKTLGNLRQTRTVYWSGESVNEKKAYGRTFNDCEEEKESKSKEGFVRCVKNW